MSERPGHPKGRPRRFDQDAALTTAMLVFWRQGYRQTSLDDLVDAMGMPRASLYQVFGDKRTLFIQCLDLYGRRFSERMTSIMATEPDGKRVLETLLNASADRMTSAAGPPGCLRCEATIELMGTDASLDEALRAANALYLAKIEGLCRRACRDGTLSEAKTRRLPMLVAALVAGMVTLARGGASRSDLAVIIEEVLTLWSDRDDTGSGR